MQSLPIDPLIPRIVSTLRDAGALVLEAPPGAGKTTRVPPALLSEVPGEIIVLEPRRLAARLAARRVAEELGERPGETVGWQVRFEDVSGPKTRIRFVTEGILTRRLLDDPELRGTGAVLLDEFHERHLQGDLALALLRRLREKRRRDLKLAVLSATLETGPVAEWLGAPVLVAEGRRFDVAIEHLPAVDARPLETQVASALRRLVAEGVDGHVLVFLPGAREIRRALEACEPVARSANLLLLPLHGDLPPADQDRAVAPSDRRKVLLSTNVAESSVTIEGVVAVVDSGLARVASHSPWTGLAQLRTGRISRASATQRAGRAGRTAPGRCLRLYTRHDFDTRPAFDEPEIRRTDLAQTALELHAAGLDPGDVAWFEPPPLPALQAAESLLRTIGAVGRDGALTPAGKRMLRFPVHPRLARLVVEGEERGIPREACVAAAALGERDIREREGLGGARAARVSADSDAVELVEAFLVARQRRFAADETRALGLDPGGARAIDRIVQQLERAATRGKAPTEPADTALQRALLAAFGDRVARRRSAESAELLLAAGGAATLAESSVVRRAQWMVALDAEERRADGTGRGGGVLVRLASAIEPDWLLDQFPDSLEERTELSWNEPARKVEAVSRLLYGALALDERAVEAPPGEDTARLLLARVKAAGLGAVADVDTMAHLLARWTFVAESFPESGVPAPAPDLVERTLAELAAGCRSFAELRDASLEGTLRAALGDKARALETLAPETFLLPGGRRLRIEYTPGQPPRAASRLQDFFGLAKGPVLGGRVPLVLELLAPNQRAVQVTTDLAGFWERHYPGIRRELMRRYPKHSWPEDPLTARPPAPGARRH